MEKKFGFSHLIPIPASDHPVSQLCDGNFTDYNGNCYQLVLDSPMSWLDANMFCNSKGARLVAVRNADDRKFVAAYIRQAVAAQNRTSKRCIQLKRHH